MNGMERELPFGFMRMTDRSTAAQDRTPRRSDTEQRRLQRMFALHHGAVWRILRRRGIAADLAAEVTQQTFVAAAERLADIEPTRERIFLIGTALELARGFPREPQRRTPARAAGAIVVAPQEPAELRQCDEALAQLNADLAEVFVLYEIEGLSSSELGLLLQIPLASVASRVQRAREQFRAALGRFTANALGSVGP